MIDSIIVLVEERASLGVLPPYQSDIYAVGRRTDRWGVTEKLQISSAYGMADRWQTTEKSVFEI